MAMEQSYFEAVKGMEAGEEWESRQRDSMNWIRQRIVNGNLLMLNAFGSWQNDPSSYGELRSSRWRKMVVAPVQNEAVAKERRAVCAWLNWAGHAQSARAIARGAHLAPHPEIDHANLPELGDYE